MNIFALVWGPPALAYSNHHLQSLEDAMARLIVKEENRIDKNKWEVN